MTQKHAETIEFIRGPFDGYLEPITAAVQPLPRQLVCYISNNVYRLFDGLREYDHCRITSAAIYDRRYLNGRWTYEFIRSVSPDHVRVHTGEITFEFEGGGPT